jgi:hypothetical protein
MDGGIACCDEVPATFNGDVHPRAAEVHEHDAFVAARRAPVRQNVVGRVEEGDVPVSQGG